MYNKDVNNVLKIQMENCANSKTSKIHKDKQKSIINFNVYVHCIMFMYYVHYRMSCHIQDDS